MKYKVIKKNIGKKNASIFSTFETEKEIIDTAFEGDIGLMFIEKDNPSISIINLKGELVENWLGKKDIVRYQNGSQTDARFTSPCSICHNGTTAYILEENASVIRMFGLKNRYIEGFSGEQYKIDLKKQTVKRKVLPIIKSAAYKGTVFFTNNVSNKCFCVSHGNLSYVIGDGKARFSISSEYKRSSFNRPTGIFLSGNKLYISDTNNHCIRQIDPSSNSIRIVFGNPLETNNLKHKLQNPSKLVIKRNMLFVLDGNSVKVTGLASSNISAVYESDKINSIEADEYRNIYIVEREDA